MTLNAAARAALSLLLSVGTVVPPTYAHHSFAMFDQDRPVTLDGVVSRFSWTNPHVFITLDVRDAQGVVTRYQIEGGSPAIHMRMGWKFNSVKTGDHVQVTMYPLRSGQPGGRVKEVKLADGTVLSITSGKE